MSLSMVLTLDVYGPPAPDYGPPAPLLKPNSVQLLFPSGLKGSICLLCAVALIIYNPNPTSSGLRKCFPERIFQEVRGQSIVSTLLID